MIDSKTLAEQVETKRRHAHLREMAHSQGVKPTSSPIDLYGITESFDVDEFLATVREWRNSDIGKRND